MGNVLGTRPATTPVLKLEVNHQSFKYLRGDTVGSNKDKEVLVTDFDFEDFNALIEQEVENRVGLDVLEVSYSVYSGQLDLVVNSQVLSGDQLDAAAQRSLTIIKENIAPYVTDEYVQNLEMLLSDDEFAGELITTRFNVFGLKRGPAGNIRALAVNNLEVVFVLGEPPEISPSELGDKISSNLVFGNLKDIEGNKVIIETGGNEVTSYYIVKTVQPIINRWVVRDQTGSGAQSSSPNRVTSVFVATGDDDFLFRVES